MNDTCSKTNHVTHRSRCCPVAPTLAPPAVGRKSKPRRRVLAGMVGAARCGFSRRCHGSEGLRRCDGGSAGPGSETLGRRPNPPTTEVDSARSRQAVRRKRSTRTNRALLATLALVASCGRSGPADENTGTSSVASPAAVAPTPPSDLHRALQNHLGAQASYLAEHGSYAGNAAVLPWGRVQVRIVASSNEGHGAVAWIPGLGTVRCGVRRGTAVVPGFEEAPDGTVVCRGRDDGTILDAMRFALDRYLVSQDRHRAERGAYARTLRPLRRFERGVSISVVTASPEGHSAVVTVPGASDLVCGVRLGTAEPPLLDGAEDGEVTCRTAHAESVPHATPSGLLLGLDGYRTLWIVFQQDSAALLARGRGLLAPRDDGFWRFDVAKDDRGLGMIVANPVSQPTRRDTVVRWRGNAPMDSLITRDLHIDFVGPRHLGHSRRAVWSDPVRTEYMEGSGVLGIAGPELAPVEPEELIDPSHIALMRAAENHCDGMSGSSWTIGRAPGRWVFEEFYTTGVRMCGFGTNQTGIEPNRDVVGHPPVALDVVRLVVPNALDAVLSPRRDAIVAVTQDSVYAFTVSPTAFGRPWAVAPSGTCSLLTSEANPDGQMVCGRPSIVMAEWALGRHVQRWTDEVGRLLRP
jgi:hypothetical protein